MISIPNILVFFADNPPPQRKLDYLIRLEGEWDGLGGESDLVRTFPSLLH